MTYDETLAIMSVLKAAYPNYYRDMKKADAAQIVTVWADMFADDDFTIVAAAVKALIKTRTSTFPPNIGEVTEKIMMIRCPAQMTGMEAWNFVRKAISNGIYGAQQEFDALPEDVRKIVGSASQIREWATMDSDTVNSVVASNFKNAYERRARSDREFAALPSGVRAVIDALSEGMSMDKIETPHSVPTLSAAKNEDAT